MSKLSTFIFLSLILVGISSQFNLIKHQIEKQETGARCLDGSQAAFYISLGAQTKKFVVFFEGGGLCRGDGLNNMLDYCLNRSKTSLGSSKNYPAQKNYSEPFMNSDPSRNPNFYNWTRIFVPYCDGSLHQGFRSYPVEYKGQKLYFRGENNTATHFQYWNKNFNFFSAESIVISGTSAGGVATYLWGNYVYKNAVNKNNVYLMPDSGIFLTDFVNPWNNRTMQYYTSTLLTITNVQTRAPIEECTKIYPGQLECFKTANLHDLLLPKTLVIQSTYDAWGLQQILGLRCLSYPTPSNILQCTDQQRVYIQKYHVGLLAGISNYTKQQRHGIWAIGCVQHGFLDTTKSYTNETYITPYPNGITLSKAVSRFLQGQNVKIIDPSVWPMNKGCNGITNGLRFE